MKIVDTLEGYRKQIKQMKRLKTYDILDKTIDEVLPTAKHTLEQLEKGGKGDGDVAKAYRRFIKECEEAARRTP